MEGNGDDVKTMRIAMMRNAVTNRNNLDAANKKYEDECVRLEQAKDKLFSNSPVRVVNVPDLQYIHDKNPNVVVYFPTDLKNNKIRKLNKEAALLGVDVVPEPEIHELNN